MGCPGFVGSSEAAALSCWCGCLRLLLGLCLSALLVVGVAGAHLLLLLHGVFANFLLVVLVLLVLLRVGVVGVLLPHRGVLSALLVLLWGVLQGYLLLLLVAAASPGKRVVGLRGVANSEAPLAFTPPDQLWLLRALRNQALGSLLLRSGGSKAV